MKESELKTRFKLTRITTYFSVIVVLLSGLILLMLGILLKTSMFISSIFTTIGIAFIVSISTSLLQRHFSYAKQYDEMRSDMEKNIKGLLNSRFDLFDACTQVGIQQLYPKWSTFCENNLPGHLENLQNNIKVIGIGLSSLSLKLVSGSLRTIIDKHLEKDIEFTFCTLQPDSEAVSVRENELNVEDSVNKAVNSSLAYLKDIQISTSSKKFHIKTIEKIIPKATILCIDDKVIFISPYFSSDRTPSSWVIETRIGDELFKKVKKDIDHILNYATDYKE